MNLSVAERPLAQSTGQKIDYPVNSASDPVSKGQCKACRDVRQLVLRCATEIHGCSDGELAHQLANGSKNCVLCSNIVSLYVPIALPPSVVPRSAQDISDSHSAIEPQLPLSAQDT